MLVSGFKQICCYGSALMCVLHWKENRMMNYIELINWFWKLDEHWQFTCCETRLYFYLLKTANGLGWVNNWTHSDDKTSANVGVSVNTMKNARNRLCQAGLISFISGGKGQRNKTRYQILTPNLTPSLTPNLIPNQTPNLTPINKLNETNNIPPIVPPNGMDENTMTKTWRDNYEVYLAELDKSYAEIIQDEEFILDRQKYYPNIDIQLSFEKVYKDYWHTQEGWKKKKNSKSNELDWKATFKNSLNQKFNQVYLQRKEHEIPRTRYKEFD